MKLFRLLFALIRMEMRHARAGDTQSTRFVETKPATDTTTEPNAHSSLAPASRKSDPVTRTAVPPPSPPCAGDAPNVDGWR